MATNTRISRLSRDVSAANIFRHKHEVVVTLRICLFKPAFKQDHQHRRYEEPWGNTCTALRNLGLLLGLCHAQGLCVGTFYREGLSCLIQYPRPKFPSIDSNWQPSSPLSYCCQIVIWKFAWFLCAGFMDHFKIHSRWCYHMLGEYILLSVWRISLQLCSNSGIQYIHFWGYTLVCFFVESLLRRLILLSC